MSTVTAPASVVVRPKRVRIVAFAFAVVFVALFTIVAVLLRDTPTGVYFQRSDQAAMIGIGVLLACGALWFTRPKATADAEGISVRNLLGTVRYEWGAVLAISFPDGATYARLELPHDEYAPVMAVQASDGAHAVAAIRAFRRLHSEYHHR